MSYKVKLEIFEGPLDLLLYLVKQNQLDIANIPIAQITDQYLQYLELMQALDLEIAGEFLVMAATLVQIKSRTLLPPEVAPLEEVEEPDLQAQLIRRLLEYQQFKEAAERLSLLEKDRFVQFSHSLPSEDDAAQAAPEEEVIEDSLFDLLTAFSQFMSGEISRDMVHEILKDEHTVEGKVALLRGMMQERDRVGFSELFGRARTKLEIVATFLALLELIRLKEVVIRQTRVFGEIFILKNTTQQTRMDR